MYLSKEYKEDYERRFNAYMMLQIKGAYKDYIRSLQRRRRECSLDEYMEGSIRLLDVLIGDEDVKIREKVAPATLEDTMTRSKHRRAIKPLTYKEKSAVFFHEVSKETLTNVAKRMGYKNASSVERLIESAKKKAKRNMEIMKENEND